MKAQLERFVENTLPESAALRVGSVTLRASHVDGDGDQWFVQDGTSFYRDKEGWHFSPPATRGATPEQAVAALVTRLLPLLDEHLKSDAIDDAWFDDDHPNARHIPGVVTDPVGRLVVTSAGIARVGDVIRYNSYGVIAVERNQ